MFHNIKELEKFDTVVTNNKLINLISEVYGKTDDMLPFLGIMKEGVIRQDNLETNTTGYIYFKEIGDLKIELHHYLYNTKKKQTMPLFSAKVDYKTKDGSTMNYNRIIKNVSERVSDVKFGLLFYKRTEKKMMNQAVAQAEACFIAVFGYIHMLQRDKKAEVRYSDGSNLSPVNNSKPNKKQSAKKSIININDITVIVRTEDNNILDRFRRHNNKHTDSWSVIGHYRTYKSGKKIWVKAYQKGSGSSKPKEYIV